MRRMRSKTDPWKKPVRRRKSSTWEGKILSLRDGSPRASAKADREKCECESGDALDLDGSAVGQHFGYALHDFGGIVAHADDGVCSVFAGMLQKQFVGVSAGFLAKVGKNGDIAANNRLQRGTEITDDAARPDDDAAHDSEIAHDAVAGKIDSCCNHCRVHAINHLFSPRRGRLPVRFYPYTQSCASTACLLFSNTWKSYSTYLRSHRSYWVSI